MSRTDPRVERSSRAIRDAALAELTASGWGALTIEAVAARAGVARSTVYRHWPDKLALVVDALEHFSTQPPPDGASGRARVVALVRHLAEVMADPKRSGIVAALIQAAEHDAALRRLHRRFTAHRRRALTAALEEMGVANPEMVSMALAGAILYARVMTGKPIEPGGAEELVTAVLGPDRSSPSSDSSR